MGTRETITGRRDNTCRGPAGISMGSCIFAEVLYIACSRNKVTSWSKMEGVKEMKPERQLGPVGPQKTLPYILREMGSP